MRCDVLIVGGGPAGSSCALALRRAGIDAVVLDRRAFPRDKTCAGWVTPQVAESLALDLADYARGRVLQPIYGFATRRIGGPEARVRERAIVSYGIRRFEFDAYLLGRAGAKLRLGEPVRAVERRGARWVVNGEIEADVLVGAGGHFCPVARRLAPPGPAPEPAVVAQELEFELTDAQASACPVDPEVPELYFTEDLRGYGWLFRKGRWLNVGLGRQDREHLGRHVEAFLRFLARGGRLPFALPEGLHGHAYLLHGQAPRPLAPAPGALLVGDAAGLAYPRSGEGIRPAVESGLLAAASIRRAGGAAPELGAAYARAVEARLGPRRARARHGLTDLLPAGATRALAGRLLGARWFARRVVVARWFTHRHTPALAPAG